MLIKAKQHIQEILHCTILQGDTPFREKHEHWMTDAPLVKKLLIAISEGVLELLLNMLLFHIKEYFKKIMRNIF